MELLKVFHMKGGTGESSYANNSYIQKKLISTAMPKTVEAITRFYAKESPMKLAIADLGCSSSPNTLFTVLEILKAVENLCETIGHRSLEYQIFFNDLPSNDFNTLFSFLSNFTENELTKPAKPPKCFFAGVPGSFYGRLFPARSLQFVHSSNSLHWLSNVPEALLDNKENIYIARTSPPNVLNAYYKQFCEDFMTFLDCRAGELVSGGGMVLSLAGRKSSDPSKGECCSIWEPLATALSRMVSEGLIEVEKLINFNLPLYTPSYEEIKLAVENQDAFSLDNLSVSEVKLNSYTGEDHPHSASHEDVATLVKHVRSVAEPLLHNHFGDGIIDECFKIYEKLIVEPMSKEKMVLTNFTISLIRS